MPAADDRHGPRQSRPLRRHPCHQRLRRALQHRRRHGDLAAPQPPVANETAGASSHAVYWQRQNLAAAIGFDEPTPMAGLGLGWVMVAANGAQPTLLTKSGGGVGFMS